MTSTLTAPVTVAPYANLSVARRVIRHVVACHIENLVEGQGLLSLNALVNNSHDSIWGDEMYADYYPNIEKGSKAALALLKRSYTDAGIEREARWLLKQDVATIARFILTAEPGELTEQGIRGAQRHIDHLHNHGCAVAVAVLNSSI